MRMLGIAALSTAVVLMLSACGTGDVLETEPAQAPNVGLVASTMGDMDYEQMMSPEELIDSRDEYAEVGPALKVVVTGAVESIEQGRNIYDGEEIIPANEPAYQYIVVEVKVDETLRAGDAGEIHDGRVYVELWQGGGKTFEDGTTGPRFSLDDWRDAIPVGTRVMLFLLEAYDGNGDMPVEHADRGLPEGAKVLQPDPQGLIFEYDGHLASDDAGGDLDVESTWDVDSIADITARVKEHLAKSG